ncbi:MAG: ThiF family adenylyltransferase [Desulfohalobiaceae bacterium]
MYGIDASLKSLARPQEEGPDCPGLGISAADLEDISCKQGLSLLDLEIRALELEIVPVKYFRNLQGFTVQEQLRLLRSSLALVGLGGLGGVLLELLSRLGVGKIKAADGDIFAEHNLNRQLLCTMSSLGESKAGAASSRCRQVNPAVQLEIVPDFLQPEDYPDFLQGQDLVLDALGGLQVRQILQEQACKAGLAVVSAALAGEMGYVSTVFPGDPGPLAFWQGAAGAEEALGCLPHAVFAVASTQCAEAVHMLCGRESRLRGSMALLDLGDFSGVEILRLD